MAAVEVGEIESPPFKNFLYELFWEYAIGITYYWLKDTSSKYASTTQMLDKSLAVIIAALKSNLLNKFVDLSQFLIREHILSQIKSPESHSNFDLPKLKRRFMTKEKVAEE